MFLIHFPKEVQLVCFFLCILNEHQWDMHKKTSGALDPSLVIYDICSRFDPDLDLWSHVEMAELV